MITDPDNETITAIPNDRASVSVGALYVVLRLQGLLEDIVAETRHVGGITHERASKALALAQALEPK